MNDSEGENFSEILTGGLPNTDVAEEPPSEV